MLFFDSKPMTTKLSNPAISRVNSLNVQESYLKVNKNSSHDLTAHTIKENRKEGYVETNGNLPNLANHNCPLLSRKDLAPRDPVSVEFAVDQWFRILLVHMQKQRVNALDDLAVPFKAKTGIINI